MKIVPPEDIWNLSPDELRRIKMMTYRYTFRELWEEHYAMNHVLKDIEYLQGNR
jgi:hypothetical protein